MPILIIEDDEGSSTVVPLFRDVLTIGRKEGNAIRLTERNVSRQHAKLVKTNGQVCVEDLGSYTGVRVNGVRISAVTPVHEGDQVQIGDYRLRIRAEPIAEVLPPTSPSIPVAAPDAPRVAAPASGEEAPAAAVDGAPAAEIRPSPTVPVGALVEQARAYGRADGVARLVVVSTDLAGNEFRIDRPSLVVGRTHENDIVLNHPSISRHHAKIVWDGERYTIVDLQSANGVRVAGESYDRVDVQPGDIIELGHVKLRLVGALEDWRFDPSQLRAKSHLRMKLGAAAVGIVLAIALIGVLRSGGRPAPPPPSAVLAAPVPAPAGPTPVALLAEARRMAAGQNWDQAVSMLDLLLSRPASDAAAAAIKPGAAELKRKVDLERRSAEIFASFQEAVAAREPDVALSRFEQIPEDSVYKARAVPAMPGVKALFTAAHLDLAEASRTQGQCDEAVAEAEKIRQVDPENRRAADIVKKCRTHAQGRAAPAPSPSPPRAEPAARPAKPTVLAAPVAAGRAGLATATASVPAPALAPEPGAAAGEADLIRQAREAWLHQQCGAAVELSRRALKLKPAASEAYQIIAVCSCSMKDRDGALKAYGKLDERNRAMVRSLCARNGLDLAE